jgi:hypothetical protein
MATFPVRVDTCVSFAWILTGSSGWSHPVLHGDRTNQYGFSGRLQFNPAPKTGLPFLTPYELSGDSLVHTSSNAQAFSIHRNHPRELTFNVPVGAIGRRRIPRVKKRRSGPVA